MMVENDEFRRCTSQSKWCRPLTWALILGILTLIYGGWHYLTSVDEAPYTLVTRIGQFEIRDYPELTIAETTCAGSTESCTSPSFRKLFGYISGLNSGEEKIEMTAPVVVQHLMDGSQVMGFVMPESLGNVPEPSDPNVSIR